MVRMPCLIIGLLALALYSPLSAADAPAIPKDPCEIAKIDAGKTIITVKVPAGKETKEISFPLSKDVKIVGKVKKIEDVKEGMMARLGGDATGQVTLIYVTEIKKPEPGGL